jgi:hypothetical protein
LQTQTSRPSAFEIRLNQTKAGRIGHHPERCRYVLGLFRAERSGQDLRATLLGDDLGVLHGDILAIIDASGQRIEAHLWAC